jgi:hypothetical protein
MPAASRDQILTLLCLLAKPGGHDPILMREVRSKLAPPAPRPIPPKTLPELLSRIREDPSFPGLAASWLARDLDTKSYSGFLARCREAWQGALPVSVLQDAYRQAIGPKAHNRGAIFQHCCFKKRE